MIKRYTFLKHPFYFVLENSREMVAGLEKCVAVFYNETIDNVEVLSFENDISSIAVLDEGFVVALRKAKKAINWIKEDQVSFRVNTSVIDQLSFQDEEENSVLEMRFLNPIDGNYDVLYFYFKNNIGNFKLSNVNEAMAITVKEVIQNLLYKQVALILKANENNAQIHNKIKGALIDSSVQEQLGQLKVEQFETAKSNYAYLLGKLTGNEVVAFTLSNEVVRKIMTYKLSLSKVELLLSESLELILNKFNPTDYYEIVSSDVILTKNTMQTAVSIKQEYLNKTQQFLDRYENAVKVLLSKKQKITGLNVGESCSPQVSPAAISDVLKKHQKKIIILFEQYPDRWGLIRAHFKPVKNIAERFISNQSRLGA